MFIKGKVQSGVTVTISYSIFSSIHNSTIGYSKLIYVYAQKEPGAYMCIVQETVRPLII